MAMMALTVLDVAGRYLFAAPVNGAFEATEVMLALVVFAGLPIVTARREHVSVRLLLDALPRRVAGVMERLADVLVLLALFGAAVLLYDKGRDLSRWGDATVLLSIPLGPVAYALAAFAGLAALAAAARLVRSVAGAGRR